MMSRVMKNQVILLCGVEIFREDKTAITKAESQCDLVPGGQFHTRSIFDGGLKGTVSTV